MENSSNHQNSPINVWDHEVEKVLAVKRHRQTKSSQPKYFCLVKFVGLSYRSSTWEREEDVLKDSIGSEKYRQYKKSCQRMNIPWIRPDCQVEDLVPIDYVIIERVIDQKVVENTYRESSSRSIQQTKKIENHKLDKDKNQANLNPTRITHRLLPDIGLWAPETATKFSQISDLRKFVKNSQNDDESKFEEDSCSTPENDEIFIENLRTQDSPMINEYSDHSPPSTNIPKKRFDSDYDELNSKKQKVCLPFEVVPQQIVENTSETRLENTIKKQNSFEKDVQHQYHHFDSYDDSFDQKKSLRSEFCLRSPESLIVDQDSLFIDMYYVKWRGLGYNECTWELVEDIGDAEYHVARYEDILKRRIKENNQAPTSLPIAFQIPTSSKLGSNHEFGFCYDFDRISFHGIQKFNQIISEINPNLFLNDCQLDGVKWLLSQWSQGKSSILSSNSDLDNIVQIIAFLDCLQDPRLVNLDLPILIVISSSNMKVWQSMFDCHSHSNIVVFNGTHKDFQIFHDKEFSLKKVKNPKNSPQFDYLTHFDICILTIDTVQSEMSFFKKIEWGVIILDKFQDSIIEIPAPFRVILSGHSTDSNIENFPLYHFLDPTFFADKSTFSDSVSHFNQFNLRREKFDYLHSYLELFSLIQVGLTSTQRQYFKVILERNRNILTQKVENRALALYKTLSDLRLIWNHPFLLDGARETIIGEFKKSQTLNYFSTENTSVLSPIIQDPLIFSSGKFVLLHKFLQIHKNDNSKCIIFSQFTDLLDLVEEYLLKYNFDYERIDEKTQGYSISSSIIRFNELPYPTIPRTKSSTLNSNIFLISTRTVECFFKFQSIQTIIDLDSDWDPRNDIHSIFRIFPCNNQKIKLLRFVSRMTTESILFSPLNQKFELTNVILKAVSVFDTPSTVTANNPPPNFDETSFDLILRRSIIGFLTSSTSENTQTWDSNEESICEYFQKWSSEINTVEFLSESKEPPIENDIQSNQFSISIEDENFWEKFLPSKLSVIRKLIESLTDEDIRWKLEVQPTLLKNCIDSVLQISREINLQRESGDYPEETPEVIDLLNIAINDCGDLFRESLDELKLLLFSIVKPRRNSRLKNQSSEAEADIHLLDKDEFEDTQLENKAEMEETKYVQKRSKGIRGKAKGGKLASSQEKEASPTNNEAVIIELKKKFIAPGILFARSILPYYKAINPQYFGDDFKAFISLATNYMSDGDKSEWMKHCENLENIFRGFLQSEKNVKVEETIREYLESKVYNHSFHASSKSLIEKVTGIRTENLNIQHFHTENLNNNQVVSIPNQNYNIQSSTPTSQSSTLLPFSTSLPSPTTFDPPSSKPNLSEIQSKLLGMGMGMGSGHFNKAMIGTQSIYSGIPAYYTSNFNFPSIGGGNTTNQFSNNNQISNHLNKTNERETHHKPLTASSPSSPTSTFLEDNNQIRDLIEKEIRIVLNAYRSINSSQIETTMTGAENEKLLILKQDLQKFQLMKFFHEQRLQQIVHRIHDTKDKISKENSLNLPQNERKKGDELDKQCDEKKIKEEHDLFSQTLRLPIPTLSTSPSPSYSSPHITSSSSSIPPPQINPPSPSSKFIHDISQSFTNQNKVKIEKDGVSLPSSTSKSSPPTQVSSPHLSTHDSKGNSTNNSPRTSHATSPSTFHATSPQQLHHQLQQLQNQQQQQQQYQQFSQPLSQQQQYQQSSNRPYSLFPTPPIGPMIQPYPFNSIPNYMFLNQQQQQEMKGFQDSVTQNQIPSGVNLSPNPYSSLNGGGMFPPMGMFTGGMFPGIGMMMYPPPLGMGIGGGGMGGLGVGVGIGGMGGGALPFSMPSTTSQPIPPSVSYPTSGRPQLNRGAYQTGMHSGMVPQSNLK